MGPVVTRVTLIIVSYRIGASSPSEASASCRYPPCVSSHKDAGHVSFIVTEPE